MSQLAIQHPPTFYTAPARSQVDSVQTHSKHSLVAVRIVGLAILISCVTVAATFAAQLHSPSHLAQSTHQNSVSQTPKRSVSTTSTPASVTTQTAEPDSTALQAVLDKWQSDNASGQFGVVVQELGGQKRSASLQPDTMFNSASLYKLFLAEYIYNKIGQGQLNLNDTLGLPRTVGDCVQRMIVVSDNDCGEGLVGALGWGSLNRAVQSGGFTETTTSPTLTTTASDMAKFLQQLLSGVLLDQSDTQTLLGYMQVQDYRMGIPAGVPGVTVADKVGIIDNVWNDAAIVYHPKGNYILVVLSTNSGPDAIKDLSTRISDFMNQ